ncbi:uncharacterized protein LOC122611422 [Drosophila teissieri]|uniref:uncharacterized protein LOC122611422 n=1 Tax=Drosophila teissieri TaxID=7243 RepID=UPI001CBA4A2B|nr:uncharacterized protein LOC122611422 [Drosophila teissieri]
MDKSFFLTLPFTDKENFVQTFKRLDPPLAHQIINMQRTPTKELNFKIQLLSGKNVLLVESPDYESELFMPQIVGGRITLQNIIPNRRCCPESRMLSDPVMGDMDSRTRIAKSPLRRSFAAANPPTPLAKSTPMNTSSLRSLAGKENAVPQLTPEGLRCRPFRLPSQGEMHIDELSCQGQAPGSLASSKSMMSAYSNNSLSQTEMSSPVISSKNVTNVHANESDRNTFTPLSISETRTSPLVLPTETYTEQNLQAMKVVHNKTKEKVAAVRTYSRKKAGTASKAKPTPVWSPLQKRKKNSSVSSTKVPSPTMKMEVRNRKLIVDTKKTLAAHDPGKLYSGPITMKKIIRKQVTGKTRKQFEALKVTAFDLLTNLCVGNISEDLAKQFQKACANRVCTTLPNYAEIAIVPPLEMDREVTAMIARQKRMERESQRPRSAMPLESNLA